MAAPNPASGCRPFGNSTSASRRGANQKYFTGSGLSVSEANIRASRPLPSLDVMFTGVSMQRCFVRNEGGVGVAPAAIARQYRRLTCLEGAILAVPIDTFAHPADRAPGSLVVVIGRGRQRAERQRNERNGSKNDPCHLRPPWLITDTNTGRVRYRLYGT